MEFANEFKPCIVFFPKVFIEDCNKTEFDRIISNYAPENITAGIDIPEDSLEELTPGPDSHVIGLSADEYLDASLQKRYDEIPKFFIDKSSWIHSTNLLCCYCHGQIPDIPFPVPLNRIKTLVPENEQISEIFSLMSRISEKADDSLLFSSKVMREVRAYKLHSVVCCDAACAGNYVRRVEDAKIINRREILTMITAIHKELYGVDVVDIPEKDLWIVMQQYCGPNGQSRTEYTNRNTNKAMKYSEALHLMK